MILVLLLFIPPVISLGIFLHKRNYTLSNAKTLLMYGIFALLVNLADFLFIFLFFKGRNFVPSQENITVSFVCKYLLLSTCIAIFAAHAVHYLINLIDYLKKNIAFNIKLESTKRKAKITAILPICGIILTLFEIRYVILVLGKRALYTYIFNISNTMPLNSDEYFNFSSISKHIILPTLIATILAVAAYFFICCFVKYKLLVTCNLKLANKEYSLFSNIARLYKFFFGAILIMAVAMCAYICFVFYLHFYNTESKLPDWVQHSNGLVAHALGGLDGQEYLNSIDAMQYNYDNGHRVFEVDLLLTSDKILVCSHDWKLFGYEGIAPNMNEFMNNKILDKYTPTSFEDIVRFMLEHPDIYIIIDKVHSNNELAFYNIINTCNSVDPAILDRIIIQVFTQSEYDEIVKKYPYFKVLYAIYASPDKDDDVISFIEETGIKVVIMWDYRVSTEFIRKLKQRGAITYAHTVNNANAFETLRYAGVYGVYTDFLKHEDIERFMNESK